MGNPGAFLEIGREEHALVPAAQACASFDDVVQPLALPAQREQASRCMACGVAFCMSGQVFAGSSKAVGCPLHNLIPETNDLLYRGRMEQAVKRLKLTNPFPEFTGRVCPAPCETACNLGVHDDPVTIHDNERAISDWEWEQGMEPLPPAPADAPFVVVVGSGPAGLACAWELARRKVRVKVVEKGDRPGGLLTYGIPNMKLPKEVVTRRIRLMEQSGIQFACNCDAVAEADTLLGEADACVLAVGAGQPRLITVPGAQLSGVVYAVDYLTEATKALLEGEAPAVSADGKDVIVLGGGDTGTDCVATAVRQGASSVTQVIRAQRPCGGGTWPLPRNDFSLDYGQRDAAEAFGHDPRMWCTDTVAICGDEAVSAVRVQDLDYTGGRHPVEGTERELAAQLVIVAKGFLGPRDEVVSAFGVTCEKGMPLCEEGTRRASGCKAVFLAGDARTGASLVSGAIADGLACAAEVCAALSES